jgi:hypothetical protein
MRAVTDESWAARASDSFRARKASGPGQKPGPRERSNGERHFGRTILNEFSPFSTVVLTPQRFHLGELLGHAEELDGHLSAAAFGFRPGKFDGGQEETTLEVIVAKQRNGPTGEVTLSFLKPYMRYENYAAEVGGYGVE